MAFFGMRPPTSLRLAMGDMGDMGGATDAFATDALASSPFTSLMASPFTVFKKPHDSHPSFDGLVLLVFEAVMEVVCVSLPGYIIARLGHFDADKQKFLANLNVMLFTPCLIFTKLASQLNADKLIDLGIIPVIFVIQTLVSYLVATIVTRCFGFNRRASNFVTAMGVFGNSNSLPISLVLSLSQTIQGLHWDKIKGDNDDEVAARGILYLLIFQQLGQLVRWSWGYHVLLAPKDKYEEYNNEAIEEGRHRGEQVQDEQERQSLIQGIESRPDTADETAVGQQPTRHHRRTPTQSTDSEAYEPAGRTPVVGPSRASPNDSEDEESFGPRKRSSSKVQANGREGIPDPATLEDIMSFPRLRSPDEVAIPTGVKGFKVRCGLAAGRQRARFSNWLLHTRRRILYSLPVPLQKLCTGVYDASKRVYGFLWEFMNPPLWAMLIAVFVASVPQLQKLFFQDPILKNSVTAAVRSSGGVAVPLILVVLGANLARNTQKRDDQADAEEKQIGTKLLVASLISRMLLPTLIMAPILALFAKYVPVSILDDPIFIIVCFLLTGAPSALQLAQICQINEVFEGVMSRILFQSYVIWILPSTLILVLCGLEVVEWAR